MAVREARASLSAGARLLDQYGPAAPVSSVSRGQRSGAWTEVGPDGVMNINIAQEDPPNVVERVAKDVGRGVIELPRRWLAAYAMPFRIQCLNRSTA